jgi:hypothetical protein
MEVARAALEQSFADGQLADEGSLKISPQGSLAFWTDGGKEQAPRLLWMFNAQYAKARQPQLTRFGVDASFAAGVQSSLRNWWKGRDSNPRPRHYECHALTS